MRTLAQADAAGALLATIAIGLVGEAARGRRLADEPPASRWLYVRDVLIKVVRTAPGLVLGVPVVHGGDAAGADGGAAEVTRLIDLVGDELLVRTLGPVSEAPATRQLLASRF